MINTATNDTYQAVIHQGKAIPLLYFKKKIGSHLEQLGIPVLFDDAVNERNEVHKDWFYADPWFAMELHAPFYDSCILADRSKGEKFFDCWLEAFEPLGAMFSTLNENRTSDSPESALYLISVFYSCKDGHVLQFIYSYQPVEDLRKGWYSLLDFIDQYECQKQDAENLGDGIYMKADKMIFLCLPKDGIWTPINPVDTRAKMLSDEYREHRNDSRIGKPQVLISEENLGNCFIWDNQWSVDMDNLELIMAKPNDIALYQGLMKRDLEKAKAFFDEQVKRMKKGAYFPLLRMEQTSRFYDYFENIISAVIFSFTSIEALANICILEEYEYPKHVRDGVKTLYSKEAIEKEFTLRDKLKFVLRDILKTPDPTKEDWWQKFILLQEIRDEIIHSKQGKAHIRYTKLLSSSIFEVVQISSRVISFYGHYIDKNQRHLLFDYPYGYGYDEVLPFFISEQEYQRMYMDMHNPYSANKD